ncbi:MAG: hypothetical protein IKP68_01395 [Clostridia bacterium]|nr:hypothetical protein [Clostridia bacterium]
MKTEYWFIRYSTSAVGESRRATDNKSRLSDGNGQTAMTGRRNNDTYTKSQVER